MLDDRKLAELMDTIDQNDKAQLAAMLLNMTSDDVAYFKGYVAGYSTAVRHLQMAQAEDSPN